MADNDTLTVFQSLKPGDRIQIQHAVKVGFNEWTTTTHGTVIRTDRRRHSLHHQRNFDDKVFSDLIVLQCEGGEVTTVTLDEFTQLERIE